MGGTLWLVGTPIGNLGDLAPRARDTLAAVDLIAAEDTRRTGRLLSGFEINKPLISLFEGNERERTDELLVRLRAGTSVALVTDGGMPAISDPGFRLIRACAEDGIDVRIVPGPSAAVAALVIFESPLRVQVLLRDILVAFGDRRVAVARELTKVHEEVHRGRASDVLSQLGDARLKGEVVVVIEGAGKGGAPDVESGVEEARALVAAGMKKRDAARAVGERRGLPANEIYRALVASSTEPARN